MAEETTPPQDQGNDQNQEQSGGDDFATRLQNQSAILGKVVNQSNNFAKDLGELKGLVETLVSKGTTATTETKTNDNEDTSEDKSKKRIPAGETEEALSFKKMQERLEALEQKDRIKAESSKKTQLARSLERHGVDQSVSDKVAKLLYTDLNDKIKIEEDGEKLNVKVQYGEDVLSTDDFAKMWLESDEGSPFKTSGKRSPTPKAHGTQPGMPSSEGLSMAEFAKRVAEQFTPGADKTEARKNASSMKLKDGN